MDDADRIPTRAVVVVPILTGSVRDAGQGDDDSGRLAHHRSSAARLEEAIGLARAIDLDIVHSEIVTVARPQPATLLGSGKVTSIGDVIEARSASLVVVDHALTPVQQRNLENSWKAKVLDRTGLILEIFGERAHTKEGALQVELAHLNYQRGRLVRSWTHLERQRGGAGFLGGPGETQIEADRRILQEKIQRIRRELDTVVRTRSLHRQQRRKVPRPIVALVGYTNAGKSTLFNRLTGAEVLAENMLFATLDPTLRRIRLPHGETVVLSDTVGFISNLPTHLVAAFRATLEEVVEADLILHVRDMSDPDSAAQVEDVRAVLASLGIDADDRRRVIDVWNKVDLLDAAGREAASRLVDGADSGTIVISAMTGEGTDALLALIESDIAGEMQHVSIHLEPQELRHLDWIYQHAGNIRRTDKDDGSVDIEMDMTALAKRDLFERKLI